MSLVPARDHLGEFLLLLDSTNGRDKVCRLMQYGAKAMKWRAEEAKLVEQAKVGHESSRASESGSARAVRAR